MKIFKNVLQYFAYPPLKEIPDFIQPERDAMRKIVARLSRGNVRLQSGLYSTAADLQVKKDALRGYRFSNAAQ